MKTLISAALTSAAISLCLIAPASAMSGHYETVCTSSTTSETPSGTYESSSGTKWAGFKTDGSVPDSLVSGGNSGSCYEILVDDH